MAKKQSDDDLYRQEMECWLRQQSISAADCDAKIDFGIGERCRIKELIKLNQQQKRIIEKRVSLAKKESELYRK